MARLRIGFLLSGGGRTLENLVSYLAEQPELGEVVRVISDRDGAYGLERAARFGIEANVMPCRRKHKESDSAAIFEQFDAQRVDLVICGGFLKLLHIPERWTNRVLNVHPSLIPKFCGQGYYGDRVHQAVLDSDETESGCTIHFVDNIYDHGPVVLQERVPVETGDTVDTLAARVFEAECRAYPRAVAAIASGRLQWVDGKPQLTELS